MSIVRGLMTPGTVRVEVTEVEAVGVAEGNGDAEAVEGSESDGRVGQMGRMGRSIT